MMRLATKEDKKWHIDEWARLFKATTWEELKMIAEKDKVYSEAANSLFKFFMFFITFRSCQSRKKRLHPCFAPLAWLRS